MSLRLQPEANDTELATTNGWSGSAPNLSGKLRRGSLRYGEAVALATHWAMTSCGRSGEIESIN